MEQRHYARLKSNLDAQLITQDLKKITCVIVDFCIHGMRLKLPEIKSISEEIGLTAGQRVTIQYTTLWSKQPRTFEVTGVIAQVSQQEIGLKIPSFQPEAFQAIRSNNAHQPLSTKKSNDLNQIKDASFDYLQKIISVDMDKLFERMNLRLHAAHDESINMSRQGLYRTVITEINTNKEKINKEIIKAIKNRYFFNKNQNDKKTHKTDVNSLSLVSHDEIEDWIHVSSIATKLNEHFNYQITEINQILADLTNQPITDKDNPFSPSSLLESLRDALQESIKDIENENEIKNFFYEEFGEILNTDYPHLINDLTTILPTSTQKTTKNRSRHHNPVNNKETSSSTDAISNDFKKVMDSLPESPTINIAGESDTKETHENDFLDKKIEPSSIAGLIHNLQKLAGYVLGNSNKENKTDTTASAISEEDTALAIDRIKSSTNQKPSSKTSQNIEDEINADASELRLMTEQERYAIDTLSNLYDKALPPTARTSQANQYVQRLESPLLKTAIKDDSILTSKNHPARRVVDLLEEFSIAEDSSGKFQDEVLQKNLDDVVNKITADFEKGSSTYLETAKESLESLLDPLQRDRLQRVAQFQESSEAAEQSRDARRKVAEYLEARFADHEIAELIELLLKEGWEQYLVTIVMHDGMKGAGWNQGEIALERLMSWSEPSFTPNSKHRYEVSAWLAMVERRLSPICSSTEQLKIFMAHATKALEQTKAPLSRPLNRIHIPAQQYMPADQSSERIRERYSYLIDRMKIGEWWDFLQNKEWVPMQLIWLSHPPGMCSFTNRAASHMKQMSLAEFEYNLDNDVIRLGKDLDLPMLERAEHAIIDESIQNIQYQATHSHIPNMWNRNGFMLNLANISRDRRRMDQLHVLMVVGFDQIGMIYTQRGMEAGDSLLHNIATTFSSHLRKEDIMAAFTESSFALLLLNVDVHYTQNVAEKILNTFKDFRFEYKDEVYSIGINLGLVTYTPSTTSPEEGVRRADAAFNAAIKTGRNTMQWYDNADAVLEEQKTLAKWAGRIDHLFRENRFFLRCQMIIPLGNNMVYKPRYEILLGIHNDEDNENLNLPSQFIPIIERLRRIHEVDLWVLGEFFDWINEHFELLESIDSFSINLSALSLSNIEILSFLHENLPLNETIASKLFFEITETVAIEGYNAAQNFINQIRQYGCRFSIDDFGSGHSSYTHLKNLSTDELKIDGFFVKDIAQSDKDYAMVKSMNEIAHSLNMHTVAEHVENIDTIKCLREIGVDYMQGYYAHKPIPLRELTSSRNTQKQGELN